MYKCMINIENIFPLFPSDNGDTEVGIETTTIDITSSPVYFLGMYKKLVLNHINFNKKVLKMFNQLDQKFDIQDVKEAGEHITYNRAWSYIDKLDITQGKHVRAIQHYNDEYLDTSLELGINFFCEVEEYEKCAHLHKILEISKELQS
jgi:hypothetical protein